MVFDLDIQRSQFSERGTVVKISSAAHVVCGAHARNGVYT